MGNNYFENLKKAVVSLSLNDQWECAAMEWYVVDCFEDESQSQSCVCGKENLKYLFLLQNENTGNYLFPIGSKCIKKFNNATLDEEVDIREQLFKLFHAVKAGKFISLSSELFSRKILSWLYEKGAFNTYYNAYDGQDDYLFMVKMFNKRNKYDITYKQDKKIKAIIVASIKPFLEEFLYSQREYNLV